MAYVIILTMKQLPQLQSLEGDKKKKTRRPADKVAYARAVAGGKSKTEAALIATGSTTRKSASVAAARIEKDITIQQAVAEAMARQGITLDKAIKPVADGLTAERTVFAGSGEDAIIDQIPDHSVRLKASSMALNLMGAMNKAEGGNTFNFVQVTNVDKDQYAL